MGTKPNEISGRSRSATPLEIGARAPKVRGVTQRGAEFSFESLGVPTLVAFMPAGFSPVCGGELDDLSLIAERADEDGVQVLVVTCDSVAVLAAWLAASNTHPSIVAVSDFWPHGEIARAFGAFDERHGIAMRTSFAIDAEGVIRDSLVSRQGEPRTTAQHARLLRALTR